MPKRGVRGIVVTGASAVQPPAANTPQLGMLAMPAAGATAPVRRWTPLERWLLLAHAGAFVLVSRLLLGPMIAGRT